MGRTGYHLYIDRAKERGRTYKQALADWRRLSGERKRIWHERADDNSEKKLKTTFLEKKLRQKTNIISKKVSAVSKPDSSSEEEASVSNRELTGYNLFCRGKTRDDIKKWRKLSERQKEKWRARAAIATYYNVGSSEEEEDVSDNEDY